MLQKPAFTIRMKNNLSNVVNLRPFCLRTVDSVLLGKIKAKDFKKKVNKK